MSFEKLRKGLHIYFGIVIFMVLLFSVCGMVDKNSNSPNDITNSNDVSKTESGLIGKWGIDIYPDATLEIKNDGTINLSVPSDGPGSSNGSLTRLLKIVNVNSTAKNLTIMTEEQHEDGNKYAYYDVIPYYLSANGKELVFGFSYFMGFNGQPLWKKK